jgi:hypothetical protein
MKKHFLNRKHFKNSKNPDALLWYLEEINAFDTGHEGIIALKVRNKNGVNQFILQIQNNTIVRMSYVSSDIPLNRQGTSRTGPIEISPA